MNRIEAFKEECRHEVSPEGRARGAVLRYLQADRMKVGDQLNLPGLFAVSAGYDPATRELLIHAITDLQEQGALTDDLILTDSGLRLLG